MAIKKKSKVTKPKKLITSTKKVMGKPRHIRLRPFDREQFDFDYFHKLDNEHKHYLINFIDENVNGRILKNGSVFNDLKAQGLKLKEIKKDKELYSEFVESRKSYNKKHNKNLTDLQFVKVLWQRDSNQKVNARRNDAYSTLINSRKIAVEETAFVKPQSDLEKDHYHNAVENKMDDGHEFFKKPDDVQFFIDCRKIDRIDKYIWHKLMEIVYLEMPKSRHFKLMHDDFKNKDKDFEAGKFKRKDYLLTLYTAVEICHLFCKEKDAQKIVIVLQNIFNQIIYPIKDDKLKGEK